MRQKTEARSPDYLKGWDDCQKTIVRMLSLLLEKPQMAKCVVDTLEVAVRVARAPEPERRQVIVYAKPPRPRREIIHG